MRVSKAQAAENRARILAETSRLIREGGIAGTGVDALSRAAGLTHGSLYSQFGSKEALMAEALTEATRRSEETVAPNLPPGGGIAAMVERYLSPRHRDQPGSGCALAAIGAEAARQGGPVRRAFTEGMQKLAGRLRVALEGRSRAPEDEALAAASTLVGALILARAVDDPDLSDRILAAARRQLTAGEAGANSD
ncbi:TetR/AcrR family transcriptional regulator [Belnapia sp. T6]|uniref:TetR/AcrR family transcriptional regulator n=1 Tax=Belnapia mucosa TaxID=2804532 RepID=A0ABS1V2S6_9PROT|nr:TetR/AcrR family transcriptional regulator [Belnapia mucosa]MBL6456000.1 TetR/AcrR family transcriptional regulator [Belnapia mucosa]